MGAVVILGDSLLDAFLELANDPGKRLGRSAVETVVDVRQDQCYVRVILRACQSRSDTLHQRGGHFEAGMGIH